MVRRYAVLYYQFFLQAVKVWLEYRMDFIIGALSVILVQFTSIYFVTVVFNHISSLNGWDFYQILFIYGIASSGRSIHHLFFDNLWTLGWQYVQPGAFDRLLIRPVNPLFHVIADRVQQDGFGQLAVGIAVLIISIPHLHYAWDVWSVIVLLLLILSSGMIFVAINLFFASFSFWMVDSSPLIVAVFQLSMFSRYPLTIYNKGIRFLLTWIIPYGFTAFYPAAYFVQHRIYVTYAIWTPIVAVLACALAYRFWQRGVQAYSGTGS